MCRSVTINFNQIRQSKLDFRTEIYLSPTVQYGFHCAHVQETHNYSIFFSGNLVCINLSKSGGKNVESTAKFSFTSLTLILQAWIIWWAPNNASRWQMGFNSAFKGLKLRTSFTVSIVTKITNAPRNQECNLDIGFHWNRSKIFVKYRHSFAPFNHIWLALRRLSRNWNLIDNVCLKKPQYCVS